MIWRWAALLGVIVAGVAAWLAAEATGLPQRVHWSDLAIAQRWAVTHPLTAAVLYVAVYIVVVAASIPVGILASVSAGVLFGPWLGTLLAAAGASLGAVALYLMARATLGAALAARAGPWLSRLRPGLTRHAFWGVLSMRLLPVVPFWVGNLVSAALGVPLPQFAAATALGILPVTAILVMLGAGLGRQLGQPPDPALLFSPRILWPLVAMAVLSLAPIALRRRPGGAA